jgi:hypothetical protein
MLRAGKWVAALAVVAGATAWVGMTSTAQEPKAAGAKGEKAVDLSALREAVVTAGKRGENVDEVRAALDALEKAAPKAQAGRVPPELQALRDAVDAATRKGENVEAIAKELAAVETAIAGRSLARPKPVPRPEPQPEPRPEFPGRGAFPNVPFPLVPNPGLAGGIDIELFNKAMELRVKAIEGMAQNLRDPEARREMEKLLAEANEMLQKAAGGGGLPVFPGGGFGDFTRRGRLGITLERVSDLAAEQLGLVNAGVAVVAVNPGSAADKFGLKVHDIVVEFAGKPVTDVPDDFVRRVNEVKPGVKVDLVVLRKGKKVDVKGVELADPSGRINERPVPRPNPRPHLTPPAGFDRVGVTVNGDGFTATAAKGDTKFVVTGTFDAAGKPTPTKVVIDRDGKTETLGAAAKLPADVEALLKVVESRK